MSNRDFVNERYRDSVKLAMLEHWNFDIAMVRNPQYTPVAEWIVDLANRNTLWNQGNDDRSVSEQAWWIVNNLASYRLKPPQKRSVIKARVLPLLRRPIEKMTTAGLKDVIYLVACPIQTQSTPGYDVSMKGNKPDLLRRVKFITYQNYVRFLKRLLIAISDGNQWSGYLHLIVQHARKYPANDTTTSSYRPEWSYEFPPTEITPFSIIKRFKTAPWKKIYRTVDAGHPIFSKPLSEIIAALPRVSCAWKNNLKDNVRGLLTYNLSPKDCPISYRPIVTAVRGKDCKHRRCYDLENYLHKVRYRQKTWECPLCSQDAIPLQNLVLVEYTT